MKHLLVILGLILFSFSNSYSQTIEIGMDAKEVKNLIEYETNEHNHKDTYGNTSSSIWSSNVIYEDGRIKEVILCCSNEPIINWRIVTDFCKNYVMKDGKLDFIQTEYNKLSTGQLKSFLYQQYIYDEKTNSYVIFIKDTTYCDKVYLDTTGLATIEFRKADEEIRKQYAEKRRRAMGEDSIAFKKFKDNWRKEIIDKKMQDSIIEVRNAEDEPFTLTNDTVKVLKTHKIYIHPLKPKYTIWSAHARILHEGNKMIDSLSNFVYYPRTVLLDSVLIQSIYQKLTEYVNTNLKSTSGLGKLSDSPEKGTYLFSIRIEPAWESVDSYHVIKTDKEATFEILFDRKLP